MAQIRVIRNRIKAVQNIQRITKTMQMIATAKFQSAFRRAMATKPYTQKVGELVAQLAGSAGSASHPLLAGPAKPAGRELMLVITSNRGLCGGYNGNLLRVANGYLRQNKDRRIDVEVVGKKGIAFFKFQKIEVAARHTQFTDVPAYALVDELASRFIEQFSSGMYDSIKVVYMQFISNARQTPRMINLMPLEAPAAEPGKSRGPTGAFEFLPDPESLLNVLLPISVKTRLFQCFNDAVVSEQIGRMVAMKAATDNAGKMRTGLKRQFNRARQTMITTELTEIISGAMALE